MTGFKQIIDTINQFGEAFDAYKDVQNERYGKLEERLEEIDAKGSRPGKTAPGEGTVAEREEKEHTRIFLDWCRKSKDVTRTQELENIQTHIEKKAGSVVIGTPSSGGVVVPEEIRRDIERLELKLSPVRDLVNVIQVGTSDVKEIVNLRGATSGWSSESGARTATLTPELRENTLAGGELFAYPKASQWALQDIFFDVRNWLVDIALPAKGQAACLA